MYKIMRGEGIVKKVIKRLGVLVLCLMLMGGIGVPSAVTNTLGSKAAVTVQAKKTDKVRKKFKKTMDGYLKVIKKYCKFAKKYNKKNNPKSMLKDYTELLEELTKVSKSIDKWSNSELNEAEMAYYLKIQTKATKLLAEVQK